MTGFDFAFFGLRQAAQPAGRLEAPPTGITWEYEQNQKL
jgi:hypothetical protein